MVTETITMVLAIKSIKKSANKENMGFLEYVIGGYDPCVNVVLLEDIAAGKLKILLQYVELSIDQCSEGS